MRYMLKYSIACLLFLLVLSSCRKEPNYDPVPEIEFRRVEQYLFEENNVKRDSLVLVIGFKDGDGNLGLSRDTASTDWQAPFNPGSAYHDNFVTTMYVKNPATSNFEPYPFPIPGFQFSGRFQRLSADDRPETLEGEIKYSINEITSDLFMLGPGAVIKFDVYIYDRNRPVPNKSNVVTTDEIILFQPM
ncbi:hypothetical protein OB13_19525 [Pontibacter sp. HJ8]